MMPGGVALEPRPCARPHAQRFATPPLTRQASSRSPTVAAHCKFDRRVNPPAWTEPLHSSGPSRAEHVGRTRLPPPCVASVQAPAEEEHAERERDAPFDFFSAWYPVAFIKWVWYAGPPASSAFLRVHAYHTRMHTYVPWCTFQSVPPPLTLCVRDLDKSKLHRFVLLDTPLVIWFDSNSTAWRVFKDEVCRRFEGSAYVLMSICVPCKFVRHPCTGNGNWARNAHPVYACTPP